MTITNDSESLTERGLTPWLFPDERVPPRSGAGGAS
jgi:hypothetical protein